jgi:hypothetical protein
MQRVDACGLAGSGLASRAVGPCHGRRLVSSHRLQSACGCHGRRGARCASPARRRRCAAPRQGSAAASSCQPACMHARPPCTPPRKRLPCTLCSDPQTTTPLLPVNHPFAARAARPPVAQAPVVSVLCMHQRAADCHRLPRQRDWRGLAPRRAAAGGEGRESALQQGGKGGCAAAGGGPAAALQQGGRAAALQVGLRVVLCLAGGGPCRLSPVLQAPNAPAGGDVA